MNDDYLRVDNPALGHFPPRFEGAEEEDISFLRNVFVNTGDQIVYYKTREGFIAISDDSETYDILLEIMEKYKDIL